MNKKKQQHPGGKLKLTSLGTEKEAGTREAAWRAIARKRKGLETGFWVLERSEVSISGVTTGNGMCGSCLCTENEYIYMK